MRVLVADNTGLTKDIQVEDQKVLQTYGKQEEGMPINNLIRIGENYFVTSHEDFNVRLFSLTDTTYTFEADLKNKSEIVSLCHNENLIYVLQKDGTVSSIEILYHDDMPYLEEPELVIKINATQANRARLNPFDTSKLVVLCKDTNPQIIDLKEKTVCWKARNVKNDYLDLAVPIFDLDCAFKSETQFFVSTALRKIRLYDTKVKDCKPVVDHQFEHSKYPLNNILISHCKTLIYVSNTEGSVVCLDPKKAFKIVGKLKGACGSIRSMVMSENHPYIATVSLDRHLRVYNTNTNTLFQKIYLKQKLSAVVLIDENVEERDDQEDLEVVKPARVTKTQNEVKKSALEMRTKAKQARLRLTFEKKNKKVKNDTPAAYEINEEYEDEEDQANEEALEDEDDY